MYSNPLFLFLDWQFVKSDLVEVKLNGDFSIPEGKRAWFPTATPWPLCACSRSGQSCCGGIQGGHVRIRTRQFCTLYFPATLVRLVSSRSIKVVLASSLKLLAKQTCDFRAWIRDPSLDRDTFTLGSRYSSFYPFRLLRLFEFLWICHRIIYLLLVLRIFHQGQGRYTVWGRQP